MAPNVQISPEALTFRFVLNKQLPATITVNNPSDRRVAFKIKTTAPKKYVVRPSSGAIEPKTSITVQVIMQAPKEYPSDLQNCKDKFMIQVTELESEEAVEKDTFNREHRKDLAEHRLRVNLEGPPAPPSPVPEASEADLEDVSRAAESDVQMGSGTIPSQADTSLAIQREEALKLQLNRVKRERDELRARLDFLELQSGSSIKAQDPKKQDKINKRVLIIKAILIALMAYFLGHYT